MHNIRKNIKFRLESASNHFVYPGFFSHSIQFSLIDMKQAAVLQYIIMHTKNYENSHVYIAKGKGNGTNFFKLTTHC